MKVRNIIGASLLAGISYLAASCYKQEAKDCWHSRENLLEEVMLDKPQTELNIIKSSFRNGDIKVAEMQHKIDSIVFSDMFQGSELAKDSNFISDYNEMMAKTQTPLTYGEFTGQYVADLNKLDEMISEKVTVREMKNITNNQILPENGGAGYLGTGRQYLLDSISHSKLFEKYKLLNESGLEKFKNLCDKVRP